VIGLVGIIVAIIGGIAADFVTSAKFRLGPHRAELRLTLDRTEVIDLGPLGSLSRPAHLGGLGYRITVKEIPLSTTNGERSLSLEDYAHLYSDQAQIRANARRALIRHSARGALFAVLAVFLVVAGMRALLGARRRRELLEMVQSRRKHVRFGVALLVAAAVTAYSVHVVRPLDDGRPSAVLRATPLAGAVVHGALLGVLVDQYGPRITRFIRENDKFYDTLTANLERAYRRAVPLEPSDATETVMFSSGLHCNIGMTQTIGRAVELWDPGSVISAGDDALGAAAVDPTCINSFAYRLRGRPVVAAPGDHDSDAASAAMRKRGFTVLDGVAVQREGMTILGDDDPRVAVIGQGLVARRAETVGEMGSRLADVACNATTPVDIVVANEPGAIRETARRGCARLVLAGAEAGQVTRTTTSGRSVVVGWVPARAAPRRTRSPSARYGRQRSRWSSSSAGRRISRCATSASSSVPTPA
jgi:hypothetical protein